MNTSLRLLIITLITSVFGLASADAINVSYGETAVDGLRKSGPSVHLAQAQTVTIEANLDSETDVENATDYANSLLEGVSPDRISLLEVTNEDKPLNVNAQKKLDSLRSKVEEGRRSAVVLSKVALGRISRGVARAGIKTGTAAYTSLKTPSRLSLMLIRFVSASGAVYVGVSWAANLPLSVDRYIQMLNATSWTGALSAGFVMFSDAYESVILDAAYFARKYDESAKLQSIYKRFKQIVFKTKAVDRAAPVGAENPGLWVDQFLKGQALEMFFVVSSNLKTAGFEQTFTIGNMGQMLLGSGEGGIGQSLFDQTINILMRDRVDKIMTSMPEGPARDAKIKRVKMYRDVGVAANSIAQVWMVMLATRGNAAMKLALHAYWLAGAYARIKVAPLENRINQKEKAQSPAPPRSTELKSKVRPPIFSKLRCEALFTT